ncbi:MAG: permease-like cell division protein FtsX [Gammaproteobacteria bacterium]|jgi:cell division transport system permease protein|nr:permease-like cell division protein FtsX [Gammaproteobacteria bacterium]MBU2179427.1 permease-like cell division protein FtsX [Gammaproteobacteria bacterium]MBU2223015.1 permease-like cell division protein FtsX [Gammaproteobacteria bacterium]MBU2277680.1 permease-like cell division protein FtsX [Gammaproteobacteria bacterium]
MSILFSGRAVGATAAQPNLLQKLLRGIFTHIRQAITSLGELWRSPLWTLITVAVLGVSMTLPTTLHLLVKNIQQVSRSYDQSFEISLFLKNDTTPTEISTLVTLLQGDAQVAKVRLIDKAAAMSEFKQQSGFGEALAFLDQNPLPDVLLITPKINQPAAAEALMQKLQKERYVELAKLDISWLERLAALMNLLQQAVYTIAILLLSAALLVIGNTIRLSIMDKKTEIEVMKLVGATDAFIQRPFLYTGIWLGVFGGFLAFVVVEVMLWWLRSAIATVTQLYQSDFVLNSLTMQEFGWLMLIAVLLGLVGSYIAVRSHIKAIEP